MKRNVKILLTILLLGVSLRAGAADGPGAWKMGETFALDSSKLSGRSFPKRLVVPKSSYSAGLQFTYLTGNSADSQLYMFLTGVNAQGSFFRVAPSFAWAYAHNRMLGVRLGYLDTDIRVDKADVSLFDDALNIPITNVAYHARTYSATLFHRHYIGLDRRGIFSLFTDVQLGYSYTDGNGGKASDHMVALSFCPGIEVFMMNNMSIQVSLGLADLSYHFARSGSTGRSDTIKAQTRLNLLDLNFGLSFYW